MAGCSCCKPATLPESGGLDYFISFGDGDISRDRRRAAVAHYTHGRVEQWKSRLKFRLGSPVPNTMADTAGHDVHFESADAGASLTYPQQAGTVRKNGFLVIKGRPCKVS